MGWKGGDRSLNQKREKVGRRIQKSGVRNRIQKGRRRNRREDEGWHGSTYVEGIPGLPVPAPAGLVYLPEQIDNSILVKSQRPRQGRARLDDYIECLSAGCGEGLVANLAHEVSEGGGDLGQCGSGLGAGAERGAAAMTPKSFNDLFFVVVSFKILRRTRNRDRADETGGRRRTLRSRLLCDE